MDLDLRQAIIANIKGKNEDQLKDMVNSAIQENEEKTLPGLGVLFEVIWKHTDEDAHQEMIDALSSSL